MSQFSRAILAVFALVLTFQTNAFAFGRKLTPPKAPQPNTILFVGSSTIEYWSTLQQDFPQATVANLGVAGSRFPDVLAEIDPIIVPYQSKKIVLYSGDNDIAFGDSADTVFENFRQVVETIHAKLPDTKIYVVSIKPCVIVTRKAKIPEVRQTNSMLEQFASQNSYLEYINTFDAMLGADGQPRQELFKWDGIHMNAQGYELWTKILTSRIF